MLFKLSDRARILSSLCYNRSFACCFIAAMFGLVVYKLRLKRKKDPGNREEEEVFGYRGCPLMATDDQHSPQEEVRDVPGNHEEPPVTEDQHSGGLKSPQEEARDVPGNHEETPVTEDQHPGGLKSPQEEAARDVPGNREEPPVTGDQHSGGLKSPQEEARDVTGNHEEPPVTEDQHAGGIKSPQEEACDVTGNHEEPPVTGDQHSGGLKSPQEEACDVPGNHEEPPVTEDQHFGGFKSPQEEAARDVPGNHEEPPAGEDGEEPRVVPLGGPGEPSRDPGAEAEPCTTPPGTEEEGDEEFDSSDYRVEHTDELYCGYDSTWETSWMSESGWSDRRRTQRHYKFDRFKNAARDMQNYRHDYPHKIRYQSWHQEHRPTPNLLFYLGMTQASPDGVYIHEFHSSEWFGNYDRLESVHTYIQWLFPLQETGVNHEAWELSKEEIEAFLQSNAAKDNLLKSYLLMLDFYGITLCNVGTGEVKRAQNWSERSDNLNNRTHNSLRLTRILKCLGTLGFAHYQAPLVRFFLEETLVRGTLPNIKDSVLNYFLFAVLDKKQRRNLIKFAYMNYERKEEFVWCPKKIQMIWSAKAALPRSNRPMGMKTQDGKGNADDRDVQVSMDDLHAETNWD